MTVSVFVSVSLCTFSFVGSKKDKRKREDDFADLGDDSQGPWATERVQATAPVAVEEKKEEQEEKQKKEAKKDEGEKEKDEKQGDSLVHIVEPDEEDEMWEKVNERKISRTLPPRPARGSTISEVGG